MTALNLEELRAAAEAGDRLKRLAHKAVDEDADLYAVHAAGLIGLHQWHFYAAANPQAVLNLLEYHDALIARAEQADVLEAENAEFAALTKSCSSQTGLNALDASEYEATWLVSELSDCVRSIERDVNTDGQNVMTMRKCAEAALIASIIFTALTDTQGGTSS